MDHWPIIEKLLVSLSIICIGYLIKKSRVLPEQTGIVLNKLILYITLPATIIKVFANTKLYSQIFILPVLAVIISIFIFLLGYITTKFIQMDAKTKGTFLIALCGFNVGLFAYPFIQQVYGDVGLMHIAMFDMGNSFIVFGLSYAISFLFSDGGDILKPLDIFKKILFFFPLDIYIVILFISITEIQIPPFGKEVINSLALPNSTLVLLTIGYFFEFNLDKSEFKALRIGLMLKYLPGILLFALIPLFFDTTRLIIKLFAIGTILPTPMVAVVYSQDRRLNPKLASIFITVTTLISFILMFIIMLKWG